MGSKITNKIQKIFAASGPTGMVSKFGTYKAGSIIYSDDPDVIQGFTGATGRTGLTGQNAWTEGWPTAVDANKSAMMQDMNAFLYVVTKEIATRDQQGIKKYLATCNYGVGSFVADGSGNVFMSIATNNIGNALSDVTKWAIYFPTRVRHIGDNHTVTYDDYMIIWSTSPVTSGHDTITIPTPSEAYKGRILYIALSASNSFDTYPVIITDTVGLNISIYQYQAKAIICDGSNWIAIGPA